MTEEEIEKQAELITGLFSYRNGHKTLKDAFIDGAHYAANEQEMIDDDIFVEFLSGLKGANVWEGTEWKYQRLWREAKKAMEE